MEEFVRSHSTKTRLASEHQSRMARHTAEQDCNGAPPTAIGGSASGSGAAAVADGEPSGGGAGDKADEEDAEMLAFLKSSTPAQVAERLLGVLQEPESSLTPLTSIIQKHDPESLLAILRQTRQAHE
ncbi:hypothetical protein GPECTOR_32g460 [Gonium pectorale]|uniref:Uncharacterized protein n=1 Tax=Gonium pectorale TaxID=33097 RepID=A0A150GDF7_GONPE|nr:hypothetical protein GPECTOR_32g460 [Gonium pectorale]|eukprot:KXZ47848.1 hypothetical protein GPECTOR_32g460 [Gonium pectorale]